MRVRGPERFVQHGVVVREIGGVVDGPGVVGPEFGLRGEVVGGDGALAGEDGAHLRGGVVLAELGELGGGVGFEVRGGDFVGVGGGWGESGDGGLRWVGLEGGAHVYACDGDGVCGWPWRSFIIIPATCFGCVEEAALTGAADVRFWWAGCSSTNQGRSLHRSELTMIWTPMKWSTLTLLLSLD